MRGAEPRVVVDNIVQFRRSEEKQWHLGRTRNISRSGMLFSSSTHLQLGCLIEIRLLKANGDIWLPEAGQRCIGEVVRQVLMSWPDVFPLFGIRFLKGQPRDIEHAAA